MKKNRHIERVGRIIGSMMLLFCTVTLISCSQKENVSEQSKEQPADQAANSSSSDASSQESDKTISEKEDMKSGFTENKERNRKEGILYVVDDTKKETLTSKNGEIYVKIPRWVGFSSELTESLGYESVHMTHTENYDRMEYELLSSWDIEEAEAEIMADFDYHINRDNVLGDIYHMTVNGIEIHYRPCYEFIHSQCIDWHYMVWADLGCGQVLKTEFCEGMKSDEAISRAYQYETVPKEVTEPLNIESIIEELYSHIEVCTAQGEPIPITYRKSLPPKNEQTSYDFSFGIVREYKKDIYRETAVCSGLIESLYGALQTGTIDELLQQNTFTVTKLSIAEKMEYIKKEETGMLIRYDSGNAYIREGTYPPTKYYLVEGADDSEEFLVYSVYNLWDERYDYMWFKCEKDGAGNIRAQKGLYAYGVDTEEHYFLSYQGNPYLCIANRDGEGIIESIVLYDFATPDYIGTVIHVDDSAVRLCSYIRNGDSYGTEMPWYLYDNHIDSGKVYFAVLEQWKITEYLGESVSLHVEDTNSEAYAREEKLTQKLKDTYLGQEINMSWDRNEHDVTSFHSASIYGYYYTSLENLYKVYRQPETLAMEAPLSCAAMRVIGFHEDIDIIVDKNGKAAMCVEGRFFRLEKSDEKTEELRTWE